MEHKDWVYLTIFVMLISTVVARERHFKLRIESERMFAEAVSYEATNLLERTCENVGNQK